MQVAMIGTGYVHQLASSRSVLRGLLDLPAWR